MIIRKLHIDGFGIFKDHTVDDFQPGINVLYGRNESGKSTMLDFIRFTLFGYPRLTDNRRPPLQGGNHGGSIDIVLKNDANISSLYRSGKNDVLFRRNGKEYKTEKEWRRFVDHAEADLYKNIYGITLDELTEKDKLTDSQMKDKIFSMGLGLADVKLGEVQTALRKQAESIYLTRGRTQKMNNLSDEIESQAEELKILEGTIDQFDAVNKELESVEAKRDVIAKKVQALGTHFEHMHILVSIFDHYVEWRRSKEELDTLPETKRIPSQVAEEYALANKKYQELTRAIGEDKFSIEKLKSELNSLNRDSIFEDHLSSEREIQQHIRVAETAFEDADRAQIQIQKYQSRQLEISNNWGTGFNREQLLQITGLQLLLTRAREIKKALDDGKDTNRRLQDRKLDLGPRRHELKEQHTQLQETEEALIIRSAKQKQSAVEKIRALKAKRDRLGGQSQTKTGNKGTWILVFMVGLFIAAAAVFIGDWGFWSIPILLSGLLLLIIALIRYFSSAQYGPSISEWESLHNEEQQLTDQIKAFEDHKKQKEQWGVTNASLAHQERELEEKIQDLEHAEQDRENEWNELIKEQPIPDDWTPEFFLSAEKEISEYLEKEKQIQNEKELLKRAQSQIERLNTLLKPFPDDKNEGLISRAQTVLDQFEQTRDTLQQKNQLEEKVETLEAGLQAKKITQDQLLEQLDHWNKAYLESDGKWADQLQLQKDRQEVAQRVDDALKAIELTTGPDALEATLQAMEGKSKVQLEEKRQTAEEELSKLKAERNEIIEQTGRLQQQIHELSKPDDLQKKLSELESLQTKMRSAQFEWLSYRIAEEVLIDAQQQFEKDKQPKVIQNSEQYFQAITNGRYKRIELSIMDSDIRLETRNGKKKKVEELSRGTREQLLLALRLGLIEEYEEQAEDLPVALDDVFVNFDAQRATQTAEVLASFAKRRQVIIFTCHSSTRDLFKPYKANILDWNPNSGQPDLPNRLTRPQ